MPGHRVGDEQDLRRIQQLLQLRHLVHQRGVDLVTSGGVDDQHVAAEVRCLALGLLRQPQHLIGASRAVAELALVDIRADRLRHDRELLPRRWTVHVHRHQHRPVPGLLQPLSKLARGRRLPRSLQTRHQDHARRLRALLEARRVLAQQVDQLVAHDLDNLLGGTECRRHLGAHRLVPDVLHQLVDDGQVHVRFEQGEADLADGLGDVLIGDGALATEVLKGALKLIGEILKHNFIDSTSSLSV